MNKRIYLCGGINALSDADAKDWREEAKSILYPAGFVVLDPMRRDFRGKEEANVAAIVQGDLFDIGASDILLVNASRPSWGTAMELMYAARCQAHRKQIFAFGAGEKPSPWLVYHCDKLFPTLADALAFLLPKFEASCVSLNGPNETRTFSTMDGAEAFVKQIAWTTGAEIHRLQMGQREQVASWCNR